MSARRINSSESSTKFQWVTVIKKKVKFTIKKSRKINTVFFLLILLLLSFLILFFDNSFTPKNTYFNINLFYYFITVMSINKIIYIFNVETGAEK